MALKKLFPKKTKEIGAGSDGSEDKSSKILEENIRLKKEIQDYQLRDLVSDQPRFNLWVIQEVDKIKDSQNQLMEFLEQNSNSEESETEPIEEEVEEDILE